VGRKGGDIRFGKHRRGFTLVELLIVLAIITVLVAIFIPVAFYVRNQTRGKVCASNLHQLGLSLQMYVDDSDGYLPDAPGDAHADSLSNSTYLLKFQDLRNSALPTQSTYIRGVLSQTNPTLKAPIFQCPNDVGTPGSGAETYGFHGSVFELAKTSYLWDPTNQRDFPKEDLEGATAQSVNGALLDQLKDPSKDRLLQDYGALWHTVLGPPTERQGASGTQQVKHGKVNVLFADSSVRPVPNTAIQ
jgi:prepilin-type N-terminal cleavage/methylation domain-containing protein/prepilin-type processing-associated H-X9-DG protein